MGNNGGENFDLRREIETRLKELVGDSLWTKAESFTQIYLNQRQNTNNMPMSIMQQQQQQFVQAQPQPNRLGQFPFQDNSTVVRQMAQQSDEAIKRAIFQMQFNPTPIKSCHPLEPVPLAAQSFSNRAEV